MHAKEQQEDPKLHLFSHVGDFSVSEVGLVEAAVYATQLITSGPLIKQMDWDDTAIMGGRI